MAYMEIYIEPIKITISSPKTLTGAILFLDQDSILQDFMEIRRLWGLDGKLLPYDQFPIWAAKPHDFPLSQQTAALLYEAKGVIGIDGQFSDDMAKAKEIAYLDRHNFEIEQLLRRHGMSVAFKNFILRALVCGEVRDEDWPIIKNREDFSYGDWIYRTSDIHLPQESDRSPDTKQEIERDRRWYWQHKRGKSYLQIAKDTPERGKIDPFRYRDNVKMQIKRYKRFLTGGNI